MMHLHDNPELFRDAVLAAAQRFGIPEIFIEKDYWITAALEAIFESEMAAEAVFKGGTALSKCYHLIERFSEDVDIVVFRRPGENDNRLKTKIRNISRIVENIMPEIDVPGVTNKLGQIRKTVHAYEKGGFKGDFGHVREQIILEVTWLGNFEPHVTMEVSCYITQLMRETGQSPLIAEYGLQPFEVQVLTKERTLCEKIMSLVRFSQTEDPYNDLSLKIRHIYDIHMLLNDQEVLDFYHSKHFDAMLNQVGIDDIKSFKNNNVWLTAHPAKAIIFSAATDTWDKIKAPYHTSFRDLVTGPLPDEAELIKTLNDVAERLNSIDWAITPEMVSKR